MAIAKPDANGIGDAMLDIQGRIVQRALVAMEVRAKELHFRADCLLRSFMSDNFSSHDWPTSRIQAFIIPVGRLVEADGNLLRNG